MTRIDFYFNVDHKLRQVAELAMLALPRQRHLFVFTPDAAVADQLEAVLWTRTPTSFLPHCRAGHRLAAETPIVIDWSEAAPPYDDVLVNLRPEQPPFFSRFRSLIEVVGQEQEDREAARARFRFYRDRGYEIRSHDVAGGRA
ncbi:MAG TPA: DNA polymerase III subunit chi [Methylophilaceae bacterium]|nr:DNA polymerase III subunit chi [Methylophilaceae bacterium]